MKILNQDFWNQRYVTQTTGWDLGEACPAFVKYFDQQTNLDLRILIPGAGNAHEVDALLDRGFRHITVVDIAPVLVEKLQEKYKGREQVTIICDDFFNHNGEYDLILEQTFFCALDPSLRSRYVTKMHELLAPNGFIVGVLFNREFEGGPPFGGNAEEYKQLFESYFQFAIFQECTHSAQPRAGTEIFIKLIKKK